MCAGGLACTSNNLLVPTAVVDIVTHAAGHGQAWLNEPALLVDALPYSSCQKDAVVKSFIYVLQQCLLQIKLRAKLSLPAIAALLCNVGIG